MKKNQQIRLALIINLLLYIFLITTISSCSNPSLNENPQTFEPEIIPSSNIKTYEFTNMPVIYNNSPKGDILLGGFSGLSYNDLDSSNNKLSFTTVTDKLPSSLKSNTTNGSPSFIPLIVNFSLDIDNKTISIINSNQVKPAHEMYLNNYINFDYEGITQTSKNDYWLVEESIPALVHINNKGELIQRFVPIKTTIKKLSIDVEALPEKYNNLKKNGFEGIAYNKDTNKLYLFLQNELKPKMIDFNKQAKHMAWVVEFDIDKQKVTAEYLYPSYNKIKISGATHYKDNDFLVIVRTKDKKTEMTNYSINKISLDKATNVLEYFIHNKENNYLKLKDYQLINTIEPIKVSKYADLSELGFNEDSKFEGMAYLNHDRISIISDNDFGIDTGTGCNLIMISLK